MALVLVVDSTLYRVQVRGGMQHVAACLSLHPVTTGTKTVPRKQLRADFYEATRGAAKAGARGALLSRRA
jgi:hypothetical protein